MFKGGKHDDLCLPPNKDSLMKYINCANYQVGIYKRCMSQNPEIPLPVGNGWKKITSENKEETLAINWIDLNPAPDSIFEPIIFSCKIIKCAKIR